MPKQIISIKDLQNSLDTASRGATAAINTATASIDPALKALNQVVTSHEQTTQSIANQTNNVYDALTQISKNVDTIKSNPFSPILGLFEPKYNIDHQHQLAQQEQLQLEKLQTAQQSADSLAKNQANAASNTFNMNVKKATLAQTKMGIAAQNVTDQMGLQKYQDYVTTNNVQGHTLEQLQTAYKANDPTKIDPNASMGDLEQAIEQKQKLQAATNSAILAAKEAQLNINAKSIANAQAATQYWLKQNSIPDLQKMVSDAQASGKGFIEAPGGTKIPLHQAVSVLADETTKAQKNYQTVLDANMAHSGLNTQYQAVEGQVARLNGTLGGGQLPVAIQTAQKQLADIQEKLSGTKNLQTQNALIAKSKDLMKQISTAKDQYIKSLPASSQPAATQFVNDGMITDAKASQTLLLNSISDPQNLTAFASPFYSAANKSLGTEFETMKDQMHNPGSAYKTLFSNNGKKGNNSDALAAVMGATGSKYTNADMLNTVLSQMQKKKLPALAVVQGTMNYATSVLQTLQKQNIPGFQGIVGPNGALTSEFYQKGADGKMHTSPQMIARVLAQRTAEMQKAGTLQKDQNLFQIFYTHMTDKNNLASYEKQYIIPQNPHEAALAKSMFGNQEVRLFEVAIHNMQNEYPTQENVVQSNANYDQQTSASASGFGNVVAAAVPPVLQPLVQGLTHQSGVNLAGHAGEAIVHGAENAGSAVAGFAGTEYNAAKALADKFKHLMGQ